MDNSQRPLVNERLYFCRLHLDYLAAELERQTISKAVLEKALGESILFHLLLTYRAYLAEIAESYALTDGEFSTAQNLVECLQGAGQESAEANELLSLEKSQSWVSELFRFSQPAKTARHSTRPAQSRSDSPLIFVAQQAATVALELKDLQAFFEALSQLISRQRTCLEEW